MQLNKLLLLLLVWCIVTDCVGGLLSGSSTSSSEKPWDGDLFIHHRSKYAKHWEEILVSEYQHTSRELKEQRKTWSRRRLEQSGISVFGAVAEPDTELFGEKVVRIVKPYTPVPFRDKFSRGDVLLLTPTDVPNVDPIVRECLVMDVGKDWISLGVGLTWLPGLWESRKVVGFYQVRLDRAAPQAPLKAQKRALQRLEQGNAGPIAELVARLFQKYDTDADILAKERPSHLGGIVSTNSLEERIQVALEETIVSTPFQPNQSQEHAIKWALQRSISLIRGPAGTGKTRVAAMLIATALNLFASQPSENVGTSSYRVLAVTHSNGAADVLLEALLELGIPAVRLGRPATVSPRMQHRTVVAMAEKLPQMAKLRRIMGDVTMDSQSRSAAAFELRQGMLDMQDLITQTAPVVVTSCIGAHQLLTENDDDDNGVDASMGAPFSLAVLDEAAQTTEPALICALAAAKAKQLVMVGDTRQLPPTITCTDLRDTLGVSPMARLERAGVGLFTLRTQYRMNPSLLQHPSDYFYKGLVGCSDEVVKRAEHEPPLGGFPWPHPPHSLAFVNVGSRDNEVQHGSGGRSNPTEATLAIEVLSTIVAAGDVKASQIAVITPYAKQVQRIRNELSSWSMRSDIQSVTVGTVDSFQGQETDLVLISAVRSNPLQELGFLRDARRLCVAITRARRGLIILGDRAVLQSCRHWGALLESCDRRGCSIDANELMARRADILAAPEAKTRRFEVENLFDHNDEFYGLFFSSSQKNLTLGNQ